MTCDENAILSNLNREQLTNWWEHGEQRYPLLSIQVPSYEPQHAENMERYWLDVDEAIARNMGRIDRTRRYGCAVPYHYVDFGASAMPIALGARPQYLNEDTIWAHPVYSELAELRDVRLREENSFYSTILRQTQRSVELAQGHHFVTPYALGGVGDTVSALYGSENFMVDLLEQPDEAAAVLQHFRELWLEAFAKNQQILRRSGNGGGIGWAGVWAPGTTFPIQEDMSYMISNELFRSFILPHVRDMVEAMEYPMFHLDGIGQLKHLDDLLRIEKLRVIQWVPGAGRWELNRWYALIQKIVDAGKSIQLYSFDPGEIDDLIKHVGGKGVLVTIGGASDEQAERLADKYCK